jgi:hypothetical protein
LLLSGICKTCDGKMNRIVEMDPKWSHKISERGFTCAKGNNTKRSTNGPKFDLNTPMLSDRLWIRRSLPPDNHAFFSFVSSCLMLIHFWSNQSRERSLPCQGAS